MKKDLLEKLKNYSKIAAAMTVVSGSANAQIVYTDVDADTTLNTFPSNYEIDFDGDGVIDVEATMTSTTYTSTSSSYSMRLAKITPVGTNISVVASSGSSSSNPYVAVLNSSNLISASNTFVTSNNNSSSSNSAFGFSLMGRWYMHSSTSTSSSSSSSSFGNWKPDDINDKYVGVKFDISGKTHYGWIRLSTTFGASSDEMSVTIKDFAYQAIADSAIYAGSIQADTAHTVIASDVADNGNGLDMQVDFNMAADEQFISEYRIMAVKSADAATFNLDSANAVASANYKAVIPTGSDFSTTFIATSTDVDGDTIANNVPYKIFILSVADNGMSVHNINGLSQESNEITLTTTSTEINDIDLTTNIYPNPVSNILNIELRKTGKYTVRLTNMLGKEFIVKKFNGQSTKIDVSELEKANYILTISNGKTITTKQIVIE